MEDKDDTLSRMIEKYLKKHENDDIHDISQGLADMINKTLIDEGMKVRNKIMDDIFG